MKITNQIYPKGGLIIAYRELNHGCSRHLETNYEEFKLKAFLLTFAIDHGRPIW